MQIEITEDGYWTDAEGRRWRLVPEKTVRQQDDAALAKAERWGAKGKNARAMAWDYLQGYYELVANAPAPNLPTHNAKVSGGGAFPPSA